MIPPSQALSLAAHELRAPLTTISGYASMLMDGDLEGDARDRAIAIIAAKAQEAEDVLSSLLLSVKLDGAGATPAVMDIDMERVTLGVIRRLSEEAQRRVHLEPFTRPVRARADEDQVGWILLNLIRNGLTYSDGAAQVCVEIRAGQLIEVAIHDCGVGIAKADQERVFEPYERASGDHVEGLGLGLALSREFARLNGGALELEHSEPGKGSTFVLRLPAAAMGGGGALGNPQPGRRVAAAVIY